MPIPVGFLSGSAPFVPFTDTFNGTTSGTRAVPAGASQVVITCYAKGGVGGGGVSTQRKAAGGGGGAKAVKTLALTGADAGVNLTYATNTVSSEVSGTIHSGAFDVLALVGAPGGISSGTAIGGAGGTASGGDTNTSGSAGSNAAGTTGGTGGNGGDGSAGGTGGDSIGDPGNPGTDPSGGGGGGPYDVGDALNGVGGTGGIGRITLAWT